MFSGRFTACSVTARFPKYGSSRSRQVLHGAQELYHRRYRARPLRGGRLRPAVCPARREGSNANSAERGGAGHDPAEGGNPGLPVPGASGAPGETDPQTDLPSDQFTPTDQPPDVEDAQPVDTIELSDQVAKRALDAFALVKDKYKDTDIENYSSLDDFVSQTDAGKKFDADIKTFGFANVDEWNTAITTVSIAYSAVAENQEEEIKKQIEDLKNDSTLTDEARKKITESLLSMIPSENNKKIIRDLIADPGYDAKLKLLTQETD